MRALGERGGLTVGQLHREVFAKGPLDRSSLEHLLGALAREGVVELVEDSFEKDGETITFQRVHLAGRTGEGRPAPVRPPVAPKKRKKARAPRAPRQRRRIEGAEGEAPAHLLGALRAWRLSEAQRKGVPAFRVLTERALHGIAALQPRNEAALRRVPGIGDAIVRSYGARLVAIVTRGGG